jgi:hypothetical protein
MTQADLIKSVGKEVRAIRKMQVAHLYCVLAMHMGRPPYPLPVYLHTTTKLE